tara:strand:- start:517 stop:936 length:420 start_codon:yes stop_codon:yes gene_type:complete
MYQDFLPVAIFIVLAIALLVAPLIIQSLVSPKFNKKGDKLDIYECGEIPEGSAWVQFNIRFYIIALIFIIFDVEVVFLFPWAVVYKDIGLLALLEVMVFLGILIVGFAYVWMKGDLDWVKMKLKYASGRYAHLQSKEKS